MPLRVRGLNEVRKTVNRLPASMAYEVYGPMAKRVLQAAARRARRSTAFTDRTGRLRASIRVETRPWTYRVQGRRIRVPDGAARLSADFPALFVEYGHGGPAPAPPHPFIRPALVDTRRRQFQVAYREGLRNYPKALRRARGGA